MTKIPSLFFTLLCALFLTQPCAAESYTPEIKQRILQLQTTMREDLSAGRNAHARSILEQAANSFHSVEVELGLIQTLMQNGEYRHALSAAAHTQAEHTDHVDATLLYAWLLAIGGQAQPAQQLLSRTLAVLPGDNSLLAMQQQLRQRQMRSAELTTGEAIQLRPFIRENGIRPGQFINSGLVINHGKHVLVYWPAATNAKTLWVRNGLGQESVAHLEQVLPEPSLARLTLEKPFNNFEPLTVAKMPFPGCPIYIVGFTAPAQTQADWPQLKIDILGAPTAALPEVYTAHILDAPTGAAVFDQQGQLIGLMKDTHNIVPLTDVFALPRHKSKNSSAPVSTLLGKRPMDEVYEVALAALVQVFVEKTKN